MITHLSTIPAIANEENIRSKPRVSKTEGHRYLTDISRHEV